MKRMLKCSSRWAPALFAATLVIALAPVSRAQAQSHNETSQTVVPGNSTAESSSQDRQQLASLTASDSSVPALPDAADSSSSSASADATPAPPQDAQAPAPAPAPAAEAAPAAPTPLAMPSMTAPLSTAAPAHTFDGGPFGMLSVTGVLSGIGLIQDNWVPGDKPTHWDLSNGQVFIQKTTGWWQFYLQAGAYNLPALGAPFLSTGHTLSNFYGPLPIGYVKLVKGGFSAEIGELPTLIGAEYTFSFENLNIERGLLWDQEPAISRGIQLNEAYKKLTASVSFNDGYYSNRYNWISGSLAWAFNAANSVSFVAGGNAGRTDYSTAATPYYQNNSALYNIIYTFSKGNWFIQPYWQYTNVPASKQLGIAKSTDTDGVALLFNYNFKHGISMAARPEYISTSGSTAAGNINLLAGPGSNAFSFTFTPTYQKGGFFVRADASVVDARSITPGDAFGAAGKDGTQVRGVIEAGFLF